MNINFNELLELGLKYELKAQKIIMENFNTKILNTCDNYKYDFETIDNIKYECKFDRKGIITNNFFIETNNYNCKKKKCLKSGISKTISNYYILITDDEITKTINYYIIDTVKLKKLLRKKGIKKTCLNNKTLIYSNGFILSKEIIKKHSNYQFIEKY